MATDFVKDEGEFLGWTGKINVFEEPFSAAERQPAPVVLIGMSADDGKLGVVGLYPTIEAANAAIQAHSVPSGYYYSVMTPALGSYTARRKMQHG